jgi:hypothetical protein
MNKKLIIAGVAAFLISLIFSFIVHGMLLHDDYAALPNLFRTDTDAQGHAPFMLLSHLLKGFAFAWVYARGISPGVPWPGQGIRFGIAMALLITVPLYLVYYAVQPMPGMVVVKQMVFDSIGTILMALAVAFVYRSASAASE